ncbi:hypothetical protein FO519_001590 [Halicephalobus sp. NKZ332]|nr:hypothetical protein FO519_001590 [Halicephalobus sp. NKZ332]
MADRRRRQVKDDESSKLTKEEEVYAKYLRFNCPIKMGFCDSDEFPYFVGAKAVDTLLESKKYGANAKEPVFKTKGDCEAFIKTLMSKGAIFRAKKVVLRKKGPEERRKKLREDKSTPTIMQQNQNFATDTTDVYAWVYNPTPLHKQVIGLLICVGVVVGCLFPLWPDWLRLVVYYLSMTGIVLLLILMGTAIARTILFGVIYAATFGKHQLWILPNLTADCGFFESFQPFYTYEYVSGDKKEKKKPKASIESDSEKLNKSQKPPTPEPVEEENNKEEEGIANDAEDDNSEGGEEHSSEGSSEPITQAFETVPAEEFVPEVSSRRRRRARRDDDFVMVDK